MVIELSELLKNKTYKKSIDFSYDKEKLIFDGEEIVFKRPIKVEGLLSVTGDILYLDLNIDTEVELMCSRCLDSFNYVLNFNVNEKFSLDEDIEDEEVTIVESENLDITEFIENSIVSTLPMKKLCDESCKGLCQRCGTNLNKSTCSCYKQDVDPRLAKLKDLFSN